MIDLDRMEQQLDQALTVPGPRRTAPPAPVATRPTPPPPPRARTAAPAPTPAPPLRATGDVRELLELGRIDEVDARVNATVDRRELVTWTTMRALLAGRQDEVRTGVDDLLGLARATEDPETWDRYWAQRFWAVLEWGGDDERHDVLDHCRERAYRFDELVWWGRLTLLLATMGKVEEAVRAFDDGLSLLERARRDDRWTDAVTDLVEGAALAGDWGRVALLQRAVPEGGMVVVGPGVVCKGSVDRYRALGFLSVGDRARAARCFDSAAAAHQAIGAAPLLARTLAQARSVAVAA
ncbi:MAG TPA: hypothetical protein VL337_02340 [Acidimicrobiales bacterium]|nr:hypothetical protein [Acidimicrobiales bacterium]